VQAVGLSIAVAIALHNIPEGVAVALPVYFATKSRWTGFKYAALSGEALCMCIGHHLCLKQTKIVTGMARRLSTGLAEPAAVIFVALVLPVDLSPELVEQMLAGVGGIMCVV
jgi:zinc transporter, ZIP family